MPQNFTVVIEQDEDGIFVGSIPSLRGCYTQGSSQEELLKNLKEVAQLCIRNQEDISVNKFVGVQNLELDYA